MDEGGRRNNAMKGRRNLSRGTNKPEEEARIVVIGGRAGRAGRAKEGQVEWNKAGRNVNLYVTEEQGQGRGRGGRKNGENRGNENSEEVTCRAREGRGAGGSKKSNSGARRSGERWTATSGIIDTDTGSIGTIPDEIVNFKSYSNRGTLSN